MAVFKPGEDRGVETDLPLLSVHRLNETLIWAPS